MRNSTISIMRDIQTRGTTESLPTARRLVSKGLVEQINPKQYRLTPSGEALILMRDLSSQGRIALLRLIANNGLPSYAIGKPTVQELCRHQGFIVKGGRVYFTRAALMPHLKAHFGTVVNHD